MNFATKRIDNIHLKFHTLSSSAKIENQLRFDKVTESLKVGTQCECMAHQCDTLSNNLHPHIATTFIVCQVN